MADFVRIHFQRRPREIPGAIGLLDCFSCVPPIKNPPRHHVRHQPDVAGVLATACHLLHPRALSNFGLIYIGEEDIRHDVGLSHYRRSRSW